MANRLVIDTREKLPLTFHNTENYEVCKDTLSFGDYGLEINGKLTCVFERKSAHDLFMTLTSGHERFNAEIARAKEANVPFYIVVEENYHNIIKKQFEGAFRIKKMQGFILAKTIHTMQLKHSIVFLFFNNREEMRDYIRNTFFAIIKRINDS